MTRSSTHRRSVAHALAAGIGTAAMVATGLVATASLASADDSRSETVYNSIPADQPGSYLSLGYTATSTHELGDYIELTGENRVAQTVTVSLTDWACETGGGSTCVTTPGSTFDHPITVSFYEARGTADNPVPGDQIGQVTQTIAVPYRPSADPDSCSGGSQWYDDGTCRNGFAFDAVFDFTDSGIVLPDHVIMAVSYSTAQFDEMPSGPSDSLNVSLTTTAPSAGTNPDLDSLIINSTNGDYSGNGGPGVFSNYEDFGYGLVFSITAAPDTEASLPSAYLQDFESDSDGVDLVARTAGTADLRAAGGCYYAEAPITNAGAQELDGYVSTRFDGYTTEFPEEGYTASADFYLDVDAPEGQFSWSDAVNGTDGKHQRDFIFHAGADGDGTWIIGASNNAATEPPYISSSSVEPAQITESGWYTFKHHFYAEDGLLYADLSVLDSSGAEVASWTLGGDSADKVPASVGGNRYGWLVNNSYEGLPIDNVLLDSEHPAVGCETDPGTIFVTTTTDGGDTATGGCVDLVDELGDVEDTKCVDADGETTFEDVAPGDHTLYFHGFDGIVAAQWYDGASTWEDATPVEVVANESTEVEMELAPGGIITGSISISGSTDLEGAAVLVTLDAQPVQWAAIDADGNYRFVEVPEGRYHVMILDGATGGYHWALAGGATSKPLTVSMPEDDDWIVDAGTMSIPEGAKAIMVGMLRAPQSWDTPAECVSAKVGSSLVSQYCGPVDSEFIIDRIPTYSSVSLTFSKAHEVPGVNGFTSSGTPVLWPSAQDSKKYGVVKTKGLDTYWVPVYWFKDVSAAIVGYTHILWMGDQGISSGYADGSYKPENTVTRKQMAIFLWNMVGHPAADLTSPSAFSDVGPGDAGYPAVAWLEQNGVVYGNADGTYGLDKNVTRKQLALYLYRLADSPSVDLPAKSPFKDVKKTDAGYKAMVWMSQTGIAAGYADGSFRPDVEINRKHMAFFLEKFYLLRA